MPCGIRLGAARRHLISRGANKNAKVLQDWSSPPEREGREHPPTARDGRRYTRGVTDISRFLMPKLEIRRGRRGDNDWMTMLRQLAVTAPSTLATSRKNRENRKRRGGAPEFKGGRQALNDDHVPDKVETGGAHCYAGNSDCATPFPV